MHRSVAGSKLRFSVAHASGEVRLFSSHSARRSDAPSPLGSLLAVLGGAIAPWPALGRYRPNAATRSSPNPNHRVFCRAQSGKVNRVLRLTRARSRAGGSEHVSRARTPLATTPEPDPRAYRHSPTLPPLRPRLARLVPWRSTERTPRTRLRVNTPSAEKNRLENSFPDENAGSRYPAAAPLPHAPDARVAMARASPSSRRSSCFGWTAPRGSTRSSS